MSIKSWISGQFEEKYNNTYVLNTAIVFFVLFSVFFTFSPIAPLCEVCEEGTFNWKVYLFGFYSMLYGFPLVLLFGLWKLGYRDMHNLCAMVLLISKICNEFIYLLTDYSTEDIMPASLGFAVGTSILLIIIKKWAK